MGNERDKNLQDTTDQMVHGHEGWLEMTSNHGHKGEDFAALFKWGCNMETDGLPQKEGLKAWAVFPTGEKKDVTLVKGSADHYSLNITTPVDGFYQLVAMHTGNYVLNKNGEYDRGTYREHPDAARAVRYEQYAQVFVPVGHGIENAPPRLDTTLEIVVPNWKRWSAGEQIVLQVIFCGSPLANKAVDIMSKGPGGFQQWQETTDGGGEIRLNTSKPGYYMMAVRHRLQEGKEGIYDETSFVATLWFMVLN
jgi:uncharacterized GH25 family protein